MTGLYACSPVVGRSSLSVAARLVHAATMAWKKRDPSVRQLVATLGMTEKTIVAARRELAEAGVCAWSEGKRPQLQRRNGVRRAVDGRAPAMRPLTPPKTAVRLSARQLAEFRGHHTALLLYVVQALFIGLSNDDYRGILGVSRATYFRAKSHMDNVSTTLALTPFYTTSSDLGTRTVLSTRECRRSTRADRPAGPRGLRPRETSSLSSDVSRTCDRAGETAGDD